MGKELENRLTQIDIKDLFIGLGKAWLAYFNEKPKKESLFVLLAQSALETGNWKSTHLYNLGNIKYSSKFSCDYCYFQCGETLSKSYAAGLVKNSNGLVQIVRNYSNDLCDVIMKPKYPGCCFVAFETLDDGCAFYLNFLHKNYIAAWDAVEKGNPSLFVNMLKAKGYFTADLTQYRNSVVSIFNGYMKNDNLNLDDIPEITDEDREKFMNLVATTLQTSINESIETGKEEENKEIS